MSDPLDANAKSPVSRRQLLGRLAAVGAATGLATPSSLANEPAHQRVTVNGRIRQSLVFWCFNSAGERWNIERTCQAAQELGCLSVEIVPPENWDVLLRHNLTCAIAPNGMSGTAFKRGFNNRSFHDELLTCMRRMIDACAEAHVPNIIAFTGYKWRDPENPRSGEISRAEGFENCVNGLRQIVPHAERRGVTICMEHLNSRDSSHPMKGHPGYQGDDLDWMASIIRRVGSERLKLLFDIYHVQIMHGDLIRRIEQNRDIVGHVHTAGVPGRGELDDRQEIQYPAVMRKLLEINYRGFVGQEFIPSRNPMDGLRQAVRLCDV